MEIIVWVSIITAVVIYIGWINTSIREIRQKLSSIEELLKSKKY